MPDKPPEPHPKLRKIGFAGFSADDAAAVPARRRNRWSINPLRDERIASAEGARFAGMADEVSKALGRRKE
jgi:hypothetical protein